MPKTGIQPADLFDAPAIGFSQGVAVGSTLYVSGQVSTGEGLAAQVAARVGVGRLGGRRRRWGAWRAS